MDAAVSDAPVLARPSIEWGLKKSFIRYLTGLPDTRNSVSSGAYVAGEGGYGFQLIDGRAFDPATGRGILKFGGDVRFSAHAGMLAVRIAEPWIEIEESGAVLTVLDSSAAADARIVLATLSTPSPCGPEGRMQSEAYLAADGVEVFGGYYAAGVALDPVRMVLFRPAPRT